MELGLYNYIVTIGWMRVVLKLEKSELSIFALIHGFSQTEGNRFRGSLGYIAAWTGLTKATVITAINSLLEKRFINKYEYTKNHIKYCEYEYNRLYVDGLVKTYEEAHESKESNHSKNLNGSLTIQENIIPHSKNLNTPLKNLNTPLKKLEYPIQKTLTNNIDNNIDNITSKKEIENKKIRSTNVSCDSAFNNSLKKTLVEDKEYKKEIKNKVQLKLLEGQSTIDEITTERLSNVDNEESKKKRMERAERAAEREAAKIIAQKNIVLKNRMKEAQQYFTDPTTLSLLERFVEVYQDVHNPLSAGAWKNLLDDMLDIPREILNDSIRNSTTCQYRKIFPINSNQRSLDVITNRNSGEKELKDFTEEERQDFIDNQLARNPDGSLMKF